jgi:hypothetical protein
MSQNDQHKTNNAGEISIPDLIVKIRSIARDIKTKWVAVLVVSLFGALLGLGYSIFKKPTYTAVCTFVLEDSKSGGLGQYAGLAALAGINMGSGGGGVFEGDNILELYKSRTMIEMALLSPCNFNGKTQLLIDRYIDQNHLRDKWKNDDQTNQINFNGDPDNFNRKQDSIVTNLVELINEKILNVTKPDKKLSIIRVEVSSKDELFSKYFTEKLVQNVNDFYVKTKTKKTLENVRILQHQADSVKMMLNLSIGGVASAIDADPNANPLMSTLRVTSQKKQVEVQANTAIYSEMVKNLELAKISLRQEIPLIQVIDKPVLPLTNNKVKTLKGIFAGFFSLAIICIIILAIRSITESIK